MKFSLRFFLFVLVLTVGFVLLPACTANSPENAAIPTATISTSTLQVVGQVGQLRQWANQAEASSSFDTPEWSAEQATGAPDTNRCGDFQTAWASAGSDAIEWLELRFPTAVHVTGVNIVQSFNPNQVVEVVLVGDFGRTLEVYRAAPQQIDRPCPYTLSISVPRTEAVYQAVRITVDQSVLGLGWNEVDAVELVGDLD
ncbi:MAG: hypothetical protein JW862_15225 [Anaerolineales bacterium]|nr:hypothetical protein [Anaerolineales bacterium]